MYFYTLKNWFVMKRLLLTALIVIGFTATIQAQEHRRYALVWNEEFNDGKLNPDVWSKIWRSNADWAIHMSSHDTLYAFEDGDLVLRGMVNDFLPNDTAPFLTGGVWSLNKKSFGFGRIDIRAKFDVAQGFWPAIWMLPQATRSLQWPYGGEIDIMEHFRSNPFVNHTVHSNYTFYLRKLYNPSQVAYPKYNEGEYNTYGMERFHDSLVFFVNGKRTFCYPRFRDGVDGQFPFSNHDYYLILDAQLGRDRSPYIDTARLPVALRVDYVRYYELDTKTDIIPEPKEFQQLSKRKYKLRKVVTDTKTFFDNPDEYRLVIKGGKAVISGNLNWAQSTLTQLIDEKGMVANVEIHDWATCPHRGIALDATCYKLSFNELKELVNLMSLYKLNYLQWNGDGACSEEEVNLLKKYARDVGVAVVSECPSRNKLDFINLDARRQIQASTRIFLHAVAGEGGLLGLGDVSHDELPKAVMALSERYWRGGSAGDVRNDNLIPDSLTPAGSRLANFEEKMALHRDRFHKDKMR